MSGKEKNSEGAEVEKPAEPAGKVEKAAETESVEEEPNPTTVPVEEPEATMLSAPPPTPTEPAAAPPQTTITSRPKRVPRKNVLYNNADYDLEGKEVRVSASDKPVLEPMVKLEEGAPARKPPAKRMTLPAEMLKGAKKRKIPPHIAEMMDQPQTTAPTSTFDDPFFTDGADLEVGAEFEVPHEDDGPPLLGPSITIDEEPDLFRDSDDDVDGDELTKPPDLERNPPSKRRGRPRRPPPANDVKTETTPQVKLKLNRPSKRILRVAPGEGVAKTAATTNQRIVKLFEDELDTATSGEPYATVINGCLAELLRKERIIDLLTNEDEIELIRQGGWMLDKPPRMPPISTEKVCFAFYVDGSKILAVKDLSIDDLRPWSSVVDASIPHSTNVKPNVRRHPVARKDNKWALVKVEPRHADLYLTEYTARLPREQRLRKKIFYLSRDNQIYGNVLILYDYTTQGNAPTVVSNPHGNDLLRGAIPEEEEQITDEDIPFEQDLVEGSRGGIFLKLRQNKLGWIQNKKQLLDYLFNKPDALEDMNALNDRLPDLPPLIETVGVFAYFVGSHSVTNQIHHAADGLSPWTTNPSNDGMSAPPRVRSTRRALFMETGGSVVMARDPRRQSELCLVETMSTLARCKRIRKRVFYIQQHTTAILGNVCYIYEFICDGPLPILYPSMDTKHYSVGTKWTPRSRAKKQQQAVLEMEQEMIEPQLHYDEDIETNVEEVIETVIDVHHQQTVHTASSIPPEQLIDIDPHMEDVLNGGYDEEFNDDPIEKAENPEPYYDQARALDAGHVYLTVRHKKVATSFECVLEYIANTSIVDQRGILNNVKPAHPPIVTNSRAYVFFVSGSAIFPHDINRDDFSPWSHNGNAENPICYRTKVRKLGVVACEQNPNHFTIKDSNYKTCPFHLVYLYSINPREPRLRKKIFYLMETQSKMVVSHAMIMYDYNTEGNLPRFNTASFKTFQKKGAFARPTAPLHDVYNDVSDISEEEKECPFAMPVEVALDGTVYLRVNDGEFWNDRNRQLQFLVNRPALLDTLGCLNHKVPTLPPAIAGKGTFVFFVSGEDVNFRSLTVDRLVPWSENVCSNPHGTTKRPKSSKTPLALNRNSQLRVWRTGAMQGEPVEFQLHVYTATLPRCPRLRKKVVYVLKDGRQCGHGMIIYWYTDPGEIPQPLNKNSNAADEYIEQLNPTIRNDVHHYLKTSTPAEVAKMIYEEHGVTLNPNMLYYMRHQEIRQDIRAGDRFAANEWTDADGAEPTTSTKTEVVVPHSEMDVKTIMEHEIIVDGDIEVEHTEIIEQVPYEMEPEPSGSSSTRSELLNRSVSGYVRGAQRHDALWRIIQNHFGTNNIDDTFDQLFKMLHERSEQRLLQSLNQAYKVEIYTDDEPMVEQVIVEEHLVPASDLDHVTEQ